MIKNGRVELDITTATELAAAQLESGMTYAVVKTQFGRVLIEQRRDILCDPVEVMKPEDAPNTKAVYNWRNQFDWYIHIDKVSSLLDMPGRTETLVAVGLCTVLLRSMIIPTELRYTDRYVLALTSLFVKHELRLISKYNPESFIYRKLLSKSGTLDKASAGYRRMLHESVGEEVRGYNHAADEIIRKLSMASANLTANGVIPSSYKTDFGLMILLTAITYENNVLTFSNETREEIMVYLKQTVADAEQNKIDISWVDITKKVLEMINHNR